MKTINFNNLQSKQPRIKYACAKQIIGWSVQRPKSVYANWPLLVKLLDSENNIFRWTAIIAIGNLAAVDRAKKIDKLLPTMIELLNTGKLVTAANTAQALGKIAQAKPYLRRKIYPALIKVEHYNYPTAECRRVVIGHVLNAFMAQPNTINNYPAVVRFIKRQTRSSRASVSRMAKQLLKTIK